MVYSLNNKKKRLFDRKSTFRVSLLTGGSVLWSLFQESYCLLKQTNTCHVFLKPPSCDHPCTVYGSSLWPAGFSWFFQALIHGLNRHYYSITINYRKNELEQKVRSPRPQSLIFCFCYGLWAVDHVELFYCSDAAEPAQEELDGGSDPAGLQQALQAQRDHRQGNAGARQELQ